ncbi:hypothetical protein ABZ806_06290 [Spirillospora sp. NPDC047418]|jgi:hypothetical protein
MQDFVSEPEGGAPDLSGRYVRGDTAAVMVGDTLDGRRILGFVYSPPPGGLTPDMFCDHVLLDGDGGVPVRPLPECGGRAERLGPLPPRRRPQMICDVAAVAAELPDLIGRLTDRAPDPAGTFFARLFDRVWGLGHLIWAAGGSVRDLIAAGPQAKVNDLDFSGTVPPGLMASLVHEVLAGMRMRRLVRIKVSSGRVCSAQFRGEDDVLLEYKALDLRGFPFRVSGGDLERDAETRDLTVNSIHYDPRHGLVLDPTLRGLADLRDGESVRQLWVPYRFDVPFEQVAILLRLVKFVARWRGEGMELRVAQSVTWAAELPDDLFARVSVGEWDKLREIRDDYLKDHPAEARNAAAREIGPAAVRLLAELDVRSGR